MKTYTDRATAPLVFHELNRFVRIPISICYHLFSGFGLIMSFTYQNSEYIDLFFTVLLIIFLIMAFLGCKNWKPSAWYALIALCAVEISYNILYLYLVWGVLESPDYAAPIVQIIFDVCVIIYYLKRKPLFFSSADTQISVKNKENIETITATPKEEEITSPEPSKEIKIENVNTDKEENPINTVFYINTKPKKLYNWLYIRKKLPLMVGMSILIFSLGLNVFLYNDTKTKSQTIIELQNEAYKTENEKGELQKKIDTYYSKQTTASMYLNELGYTTEEIDIIVNSIPDPFLESLVIKEKIANGEALTDREILFKKLIMK